MTVEQFAAGPIRKGGKAMLRTVVACVTVLCLLSLGGTGYAQAKYPSKPIDIIVPFSAGGSTDLTARIEAAYLSKKWGVPVNVVNKAGATPFPRALRFTGLIRTDTLF